MTHLSLIKPSLSFPFLSFPSLLYPCASAQPKRIERFSRLMAETTCSATRKCLLWVTIDKNQILRASYPQNRPIFPLKWEFPTKNKNLNNSKKVRDRAKLIIYHRQEIMDCLSESALTFDLRRHLAEKPA